MKLVNYSTAFESILDRLANSRFSSTDEILHLEPRLFGSHKKWFDILYDAIIEKQAVVLEYNVIKIQRLVVSPLSLKVDKNILYLIGISHSDPQNTNALVFNLEKIICISLSEEEFQKPSDLKAPESFKFS